MYLPINRLTVDRESSVQSISIIHMQTAGNLLPLLIRNYTPLRNNSHHCMGLKKNTKAVQSFHPPFPARSPPRRFSHPGIETTYVRSSESTSWTGRGASIAY